MARARRYELLSLWLPLAAGLLALGLIAIASVRYQTKHDLTVSGWRAELIGGPRSYDPQFLVVGHWSPERPSPWEPDASMVSPIYTQARIFLVDWEKVVRNRDEFRLPTIYLPGVGEVTPSQYWR